MALLLLLVVVVLAIAVVMQLRQLIDEGAEALALLYSRRVQQCRGHFH